MINLNLPRYGELLQTVLQIILYSLLIVLIALLLNSKYF